MCSVSRAEEDVFANGLATESARIYKGLLDPLGRQLKWNVVVPSTDLQQQNYKLEYLHGLHLTCTMNVCLELLETAALRAQLI